MEDLVYLIGPVDAHTAKIGHSIAPEARLRQMQTANPTRLTILWTCPGGQRLERRLHSYLTGYRLHGEWFDFGELDPVDTVRQAVAEIYRDGDQPARKATPSPKVNLSGPMPDCTCGHAYEKHVGAGCATWGYDESRDCHCRVYTLPA